MLQPHTAGQIGTQPSRVQADLLTTQGQGQGDNAIAKVEAQPCGQFMHQGGLPHTAGATDGDDLAVLEDEQAHDLGQFGGAAKQAGRSLEAARQRGRWLDCGWRRTGVTLARQTVADGAVESRNAPEGEIAGEAIVQAGARPPERLFHRYTGDQLLVEGLGEQSRPIVADAGLSTQHRRDTVLHQGEGEVRRWLGAIGGTASVEEGEVGAPAQVNRQVAHRLGFHRTSTIVKTENGLAVAHAAVAGVVKQDRLRAGQIDQGVAGRGNTMPAQRGRRLLGAQVVAQGVEFTGDTQALQGFVPF